MTGEQRDLGNENKAAHNRMLIKVVALVLLA